MSKFHVGRLGKTARVGGEGLRGQGWRAALRGPRGLGGTRPQWGAGGRDAKPRRGRGLGGELLGRDVSASARGGALAPESVCA